MGIENPLDPLDSIEKVAGLLDRFRAWRMKTMHAKEMRRRRAAAQATQVLASTLNSRLLRLLETPEKDDESRGVIVAAAVALRAGIESPRLYDVWPLEFPTPERVLTVDDVLEDVMRNGFIESIPWINAIEAETVQVGKAPLWAIDGDTSDAFRLKQFMRVFALRSADRLRRKQ